MICTHAPGVRARIRGRRSGRRERDRTVPRQARGGLPARLRHAGRPFALKDGVNTSAARRQARSCAETGAAAAPAAFLRRSATASGSSRCKARPVTLKGQPVDRGDRSGVRREGSARRARRRRRPRCGCTMSGDRRTVRVRDVERRAPRRPSRVFAGFRSIRDTASPRSFVKDAPPQRRAGFQISSATRKLYTTEGRAEFTMDGKTDDAADDHPAGPPVFHLPRRHERRGDVRDGALPLRGPGKPDGTAVLDFNQVYNPPGSFNPYTTCPLPPRRIA